MAKTILVGKMNKWELRWLFEPRDCWLGVYWDKHINALDIYLCVVPMLPLRLRISWDIKLPEGLTVEGDQVFVNGQPILSEPEAEDKQMYWEVLERVFLEAWQNK